MKLYIAIALLACTAFALRATSNVTILRCDGTSCAGTKCQTYNFDNNTCDYGLKYTCAASLDQCVDLIEYNGLSNTTCVPNNFRGTSTTVCDFCFSVPKPDGTMMHGKVSNCRDNSRRAFHHECDSKCQNCKMITMLPQNQCVPNPLMNHSVSVQNSRPCNKVVTVQQYNARNCSGGLKMSSAVAANTCIVDNMLMSTEFKC